MKILGNRVLVSKIEEPKGEGFQTVEVQDSFVNKGRIEQIGEPIPDGIRSIGQTMTLTGASTMVYTQSGLKVGDTILFAKYSPDTQDIEHEGEKYKVVLVSDIIAVL